MSRLAGARLLWLAIAGLLPACSIAVAGCGYRAANDAHDPLGPFEVVPERARVPEAGALAAAAAGARAELARAGQLGGCRRAAAGGCATVSIEVTRVDEAPVGIAAVGPPDEQQPRARGLRITVTGRARVLRDGALVRETPDVATTESFAAQGDPAAALVGREDAARIASTRLGARLVRLLLGYPEPAME